MMYSKLYVDFNMNNIVSNAIPLECPMNNQNFENEEYECSGMKIVIMYPEMTSNDENVKREVHEIMVSALRDQLTS